MSHSTNTRRTFLQRAAQMTAAASAAGFSPIFGTEPTDCAGPKTPKAIIWKPDTNPILPRLPASTLPAAEVTKLRDAYAALRKLATTTPGDPRGWLQQGDKHCWNCGGGLDGVAGEEIHGSWLFLPWHRAYLYFHERILGKLIGDKNLRLAYWDWNDNVHRAIPPAWVTPNNSTNSLFDANRSAVAGDMAPLSIVGPAIMNPILAAGTFTAFGGSAGAAGNLENGPHGAVHIWCGDTTMASANPDMGLLDTAAQDPIFFAHHCNIDRLWNVWLGGAPTHKNPTSATWLNHRFTFWNEEKHWVSISVADVINMSNNLRYTYDNLLFPFPLNVPLPVPTQITSDPSGALVFPADFLKRMNSPANVENKSKLTTLRVEGITLPSNAGGIYRIVANKPTALAAEVAGTMNDLGYIAVVPKTSKSGAHMHANLTIDLNVTDQLPQLLQENAKLNLSIVPMGASAKSTQLKYKNVYIVEQ